MTRSDYPKYVGILGGGQLGRLLSLDAARLGFDVHIFCPELDCPAARVSARKTVADYDNQEALQQFAQSCEVVTYEFENVPVSAIEFVERLGTEVFPSSLALKYSQDRLTEKEYLNSVGIPTVDYQSINCSKDLESIIFKTNGILKLRRLGYDGKGQRFVSNSDELTTAWNALGEQPAILENLVDFEREISVVACRDRDGRFEAFEPSENFHKDGILRRSKVPANISEQTAILAINATRNLLESLKYVGVLALEFFVLPGGDILANEFAPRVHNSGHWSPRACNVGQFEQHIRAITGNPLISPQRYHNVEMINLLGDSIVQHTGADGYTSYGKREIKEGRKMGHVVRILE